MENNTGITNIPKPESEQLYTEGAMAWITLAGIGGGMATIAAGSYILEIIGIKQESIWIAGGIGILIFFGARSMAKIEMKKTENICFYQKKLEEPKEDEIPMGGEGD